MLTKNLKIFNSRYRMQILVALTYNIMNFSYGMGIGWISPIIEIIQSPESPLDFIVTVEQVSWIGSMFGFGFLSGNIIFGPTAYRFSRICMYLLAISHLLFWILNYIVQSVEYLYAGRFFAGVTSGGLFSVGPIFFSEILDKEVRGPLITVGMMFLSCGLLVGFILPTKVDYFLIPLIALVLPVIFIIGFCFFPDTPQNLLRSGRQDKAEAAFRFYKGPVNKDEIQRRASIASNEFEELKSIILTRSSATFGDFFTKTAIKSLADAFMLCILHQLSGSFAFLNYMTSIFAVSGSTMDPYLSTIIVGVSHIIGSLCASLFVERFGRRLVLFSSTCVMIVGMYAFGAFVQFTDAETKDQDNWLPVLFMVIVVFNSAFGIFGNFYTIAVEILPVKIRIEAYFIAKIFLSLLVFLILKLYPYFLFELGIPATMYTSATISLVTGIYLYIFLPETKGKSMDKH